MLYQKDAWLPLDAWHDVGELSPEMANTWIQRVNESWRYRLLPVPNLWPSEMGAVMGWRDETITTRPMLVAMGVVRH